jgi:hypothetical protein
MNIKKKKNFKSNPKKNDLKKIRREKVSCTQPSLGSNDSYRRQDIRNHSVHSGFVPGIPGKTGFPKKIRVFEFFFKILWKKLKIRFQDPVQTAPARLLASLVFRFNVLYFKNKLLCEPVFATFFSKWPRDHVFYKQTWHDYKCLL